MIQFEVVSKVYNENTRKSKSLREVFSFNKKNRPEGEGKFIAVDNVSFSVDKGEAVAIVGHNGAGKSTLLKLLTRIILPTEGLIKVNGTLSSLLEVGTGFHHELTGLENIFLSGAILGMNRQNVKEKLTEIIDFSEMKKFIDLPVKYYSSGMYLRLAFSIGVHLDSDILVIDEALAVGDISFQNKCFNKINQIKKEGKTIVLVSHAEQQVIDLCSRCLVMDHGKLIFSGETVQALDIYRKII